MKRLSTATILLLLLLPLLGSAQDLGLDTAYFYDRYGSQVADQKPSKLFFGVPWRGSTCPQIKGDFKKRTYKDGKLTVHVYFSLPDLKAVAVEYQLPHKWTEEQLAKALEVYSKKWQPAEGQHLQAGPFIPLLGQRVLMSEEGLYAHLSPFVNRLIVLSPDILKAFDKARAEIEAERKKVPKF